MSTPDTATAGLIQRLDAVDALPGAAELRARSYDLLRLNPGDPVVDIGTGSGRAVAELATRAAHPIGIDPNEQMLHAARTRWPALDFRPGSAEDIPLPGESVAGYRADKVFHEITDPTAALTQARRILRPGGRIVLLGQDWDTLVIDSDHPDTTRALVHARADTLPNPRAARSYRTFLLDNGFHDITLEVHTLILTGPQVLPLITGLVTPGNIDTGTWLNEQTARAHSDRLLIALPLFLAAATRP